MINRNKKNTSIAEDMQFTKDNFNPNNIKSDFLVKKIDEAND